MDLGDFERGLDRCEGRYWHGGNGRAWGKLTGREEPWADVKKLARARGGPKPVRLLLGGSGARPAKAGGLLGPSG